MTYTTSELFKLWAEDKLWLVHDPKTLEGFMMVAESKKIIPNENEPDSVTCYLVNEEFDSIWEQLIQSNKQRYVTRYDHC